jgi:hypothetical protein
MSFRANRYAAEFEAMWIYFETTHSDIPYHIKVYAGGVNVINAEPAVEDMGSRLRRHMRLGETSANSQTATPLQDYIVVPGQQWLDGIANGDGTVRQFVAMPLGSGHSIESQITRQDNTAGIQIEVTPYQTPVAQDFPGTPMQIFLKTLTGSTKTFNVTHLESIYNFKLRIQEALGCPPRDVRLIFAGKQLEGTLTLDNRDTGTILTCLQITTPSTRTASARSPQSTWFFVSAEPAPSNSPPRK